MFNGLIRGTNADWHNGHRWRVDQIYWTNYGIAAYAFIGIKCRGFVRGKDFKALGGCDVGFLKFIFDLKVEIFF